MGLYASASQSNNNGGTLAVIHGNDYQSQARWRDIPKRPPLDPEIDQNKLSCLKCKEEDLKK